MYRPVDQPNQNIFCALFYFVLHDLNKVLSFVFSGEGITFVSLVPSVSMILFSRITYLFTLIFLLIDVYINI
jgi:hypothetical protein